MHSFTCLLHRIRKTALASILLLTTALVAAVPGDLADDDPVWKSVYTSYDLQGHSAYAPLPPKEAKENLLALVRQTPDRIDLYRKLADVEVQLLHFDEAESAMRTYAEKSAQREQAYSELAAYYHSRLDFPNELRALEEQARSLQSSETDIERRSGRYAVYHRILSHIRRYGLAEDPAGYYREMIRSYPDERTPYLEFIEFLKDRDPIAAFATLDEFHGRFPDDEPTYLQTKASLLDPAQAFELLNSAYDPVWDLQLIRALDGYARQSGKQAEYIHSLQDRVETDPLDFNAVSRIFYAFYLQGSLLEAQNTLSDFRLVKEKAVSERRDIWRTGELYGMARLSELILQHNDAGRFYYSLYSRLRYEPDPVLLPDDALFGIYRVLLAAGNRPVQIGAGNLDYYQDIAQADPHPGILSGILSLIFNSTDPVEEFRAQEEKALGYFNRGEAMRLLRYTQRFYPSSPHLAEMHTRSLRVYEQYGMDELLVRTGEDFIRKFPDSEQVLPAGIAVADAYSRMKQHENEWKTYEMLLPFAASLGGEPLLPSSGAASEHEDADHYEEYDDYEDEWTPRRITGRQDEPKLNYESILNRYISSLTSRKNYLGVVRLYKNQIEAHPSEEGLYERFASYLEQNRLFEEEQKAYQQAISRFQGLSWYEKLARFYLRQRREKELEDLTLQVLRLFRGTEVENYFDHVLSRSRDFQQLYVSLNLHAHNRFPLNLTFAQNLMNHYSSVNAWEEWEALAVRYYFLQEHIRNQYLTRLAKTGRLPAMENREERKHHPVEARFTADVYIWNSHFEEAVPILDRLSDEYSSDLPLNGLRADLKRSLGARNPDDSYASARIREHLARIEPSRSELWITAGDTLAEIEKYSDAEEFWNQVLKADPMHPDSYLNVATIQWDYYLFDEALATIGKIRKLRDDPTLLTFEAGAIHESAGRTEMALEEYAGNLSSEPARRRLSQLYRRNVWKSHIRQLIHRLLEDPTQNENRWGDAIRFYAEERDTDQQREIVRRALDRLSSESFARTAGILLQAARDAGFADLHERILHRQIDEATSEAVRLQRTVELARFYEGRKEPSKAERIYLTLFRQNPRSADLIEELTSFYRRSGQYDKAFDIYEQVLPHANIRYRKQFMQDMIADYREIKNFAGALPVAKNLLALDPLNSSVFQLVAEILAEKDDFPALTEHYKQGLDNLRISDLPEEEKKARTAELRRGMIEALSILQDYVSALDQYIEMINRDAENEELLHAASAFASRYKLTERLLDYYQKTSIASPKDHRWPMILGRIDLFEGKFDSATSAFLRAIELRPERIDLRASLADCYIRSGKFEDAIRVYDHLYVLTYRDRKWQTAAAELHARLGRKEKAMELYRGSWNAAPSPDREFALCRKALEWGWPEEAVRHGQSAMELYWKDLSQTLVSEDISAYLEAVMQTEKRADAFLILNSVTDRVEIALESATFHAEQLRSTRYILHDIFAQAFPRLIQKYFTGEDYETLEDRLLTALAGRNEAEAAAQIQSRYLRMTSAAGMGPAEEKLLLRLNEGAVRSSMQYGDSAWSQQRRWRSELKEFYLKRHAFRQCAEWLRRDWQRNDRKNSHYRDLVEIAEAYRLAEMPAEEIETLKEYYGYGLRYTLEAAPVERYLDLLYSQERSQEIRSAAARANLISANHFVRRGDLQNAQTAIRSLYEKNQKKLQPVWQTVHTAMLGWQFQRREAGQDNLFETALDLYPVGDLLQQRTDSPLSIEGDLWFYFATRYGEYLWWDGDRDQASYYLVADLEGAPAAAGRQGDLASFYLRHKEWAGALSHAQLARQLDPARLEWADLEARATMEAGRKTDAVDLWRKMSTLSSRNRELQAWRLILKASTDYSFFPEIQTELDDFLSAKISKTGETEIRDLLSTYWNALDNQQAETVSRMILQSPSPGSFGHSLLDYSLSEEGTLSIFETVSSYFSDRLSTASGREYDSVLNQWIRWNHLHIRTLLEFGKNDSAWKAAKDLQDGIRNENAAENLKEGSVLLYAKTLLRNGLEQDAIRELKDYVTGTGLTESSREDRFRKAADLLDSEGFKGPARDFQQQMYEEQMATGHPQQAAYIGLAGILMERKEFARANALLHRMIYFYGENLPALEAAAELMESAQQLEEAVWYRRELSRREPWNERNKAKLAEDLLTMQRPEESIPVAAEIIATSRADSESRARAAFVYGSASKLSATGPLELQKIIAIPRGDTTSEATAYEHLYRVALIRQVPDDADSLRAEILLFPEDHKLQAEIFSLYVRDGRCDQALYTADPRMERKEPYYKPQRSEFRLPSHEEEWEYDYYYVPEYSIERWKLPDESTVRLASQAAECSAQTGDANGQIFFLKMAAFHSAKRHDKIRIRTRIESVERRISEDREKEDRRFKIQMNLERAS